jgi:hypothetical protein
LSGRRRYFNKRRSKDQIWHHRGNGWGVRGWHHWLAKDQNKFSLPVSACDGLNRCGFMLSMDALEGVKASECSAYATARIVHKEKRRASAACSGADAFFVFFLFFMRYVACYFPVTRFSHGRCAAVLKVILHITEELEEGFTVPCCIIRARFDVCGAPFQDRDLQGPASVCASQGLCGTLGSRAPSASRSIIPRDGVLGALRLSSSLGLIKLLLECGWRGMSLRSGPRCFLSRTPPTGVTAFAFATASELKLSKSPLLIP